MHKLLDFLQTNVGESLKPVFLFVASEGFYFVNFALHIIGLTLSVFYTGFKIYTEIIKPRKHKKK